MKWENRIYAQGSFGLPPSPPPPEHSIAGSTATGNSQQPCSNQQSNRPLLTFTLTFTAVHRSSFILHSLPPSVFYFYFFEPIFFLQNPQMINCSGMNECKCQILILHSLFVVETKTPALQVSRHWGFSGQTKYLRPRFSFHWFGNSIIVFLQYCWIALISSSHSLSATLYYRIFEPRFRRFPEI